MDFIKTDTYAENQAVFIQESPNHEPVLLLTNQAWDFVSWLVNDRAVFGLIHIEGDVAGTL